MRQQALQLRVFPLYLGRQHALLVAEPIAFQQDIPGSVVRLQDAPPTIQLDKPRPPVLEQFGKRRAQRLSIGHRMPDARELAYVRRETLDGLDLIVPPASAFSGVAEGQDDRTPVLHGSPQVLGLT